MKKNLLSLSIVLLGLGAVAQTPRLSLYEEFTGENCGPCAQTNPGLNAYLSAPTNTPKVVAIKWQVPIPSAPSATWSLYKTDKAEIDWRYGAAPGGYGYPAQYTATNSITSGINSAPTGFFDGQHQWAFGAASDHPAYMSNNLITAAQSHTSAFSVTMQRDWDATGSAVNLTVSIQATAPFTASGSLVFRTVMIEEYIKFATAPGTNGETEFYNTAIKCFPNTGGTPIAGTWTVGQTQTFTLNCPIPSYTRMKEQIGFVGFIQDDGNRKVAQAVRSSKVKLTNDAVASAAKVPVTCNSSIYPEVTVYNNGTSAITALTITPATDNVTGQITTWTGNLAPGASTNIQLNSLTAPSTTASGAHAFTYTITAMNGVDFNTNNNTGKVSYMIASTYQNNPIVQGFALGTFPPAGYVVSNPDNGPAWSRVMTGGGYATSLESAKYDFFNNTVIGDQDEFILPPSDLSGTADPQMQFDIAYAQRSGTENDMLDVFASDDCGATWTNVFSASGSNLTIIGAVSNSYVPSANDWITEYISLTGFNKPNVIVKFVVTNDNGNNLYLDNINLSQPQPLVTGIKAQTAETSVSMYPNPTTALTTISIRTPKASAGKVTVMNLFGQVVISKDLNLNEGENTLQLDMKEYAAGIYNVQISTASETIVKKLNLNK